jgi:hypothetical protein
MEKIDRLGWAVGAAFTAFGIRVGVRTNQADVWDRIVERFPIGWKPTALTVEKMYSLRVGAAQGTIRQFHLLYGNIDRLARTMDLEAALDRLEADMKIYVAAATWRWTFVHAGVVGWNGRAIVLPGLTLSGKSTLVAELVRAGATYYSDEYAVIDRRGRVHPYARPLAMRETYTARQTKRPVEFFGGRAGRKPLPVGLVVVSQYKAGADWRPRRLSAGRGLLALLNHTVSARHRPQVAVPTLRNVVAEAPVLEGARGDAKGMVGLLLNTAGGDGSRPRAGGSHGKS